MTLGERIKNYRQRAGLSQEQLAEIINVSRQAITKWENDSGMPDIDNLISLSKVILPISNDSHYLLLSWKFGLSFLLVHKCCLIKF